MRQATKWIIGSAVDNIRSAFKAVGVKDADGAEREFPRDAGMINCTDLEDCKAHLQVALASIDQALELEK